MPKWVLLTVFLSGALMSVLNAADTDSSTPAPPVARKIPRETVLHGETLVDDYCWLREKTHPEVVAYLEAENAYTAAVMKPTAALQESLYKEMLGRIKQTNLSVPYRQDGYFYYSRTEEGKQYPIYCRKPVLSGAEGNVAEGKGSLEAVEEVTLDLNELAAGHTFMALGVYAVSDDGKLLAYSTDSTGFRQYTLFVKDLVTGRLLPDRTEKVVTVTWAGDNKTLFYTVEDSAKRSYRLYRHSLGASSAPLLYEEKDERFRVYVGRSLSKAYLFLTSASHTASEVRYLPADQPESEWMLVAGREPEHEYDLDHHGDRFYIRTNSGGRNFRLVAAPVAAPGRENWEEIIPHRKDVMLEGVMFFARHYVLFERESGLPQFTITDIRSGKSQRIEFPEPAYAAVASTNREFDTNAFRYSYQSLVTPSSVFDFDIEKRESKLLKQTEILGGYDASRYQSERLHATAPDGTPVPVSLIYRKGLKRDGSAPLLLTGYGSYGFPLPVTFSSNRLSLLDRGFVIALAHVRGGGEMGKPWHDQGRMMNKKNTFTDFIAVAEHLIAQKFTASDRLIIQGGSAGGLLVGAVTNLRPELFKAVVALVPFVDVINSMSDASLPLTVGEFEEWGNPKNKPEYDYIKSYCPYTNLARKAYPNMLVRTSFHDSQVMYWEPAKYVAKLRALQTERNVLLFKTNLAAGHGGASGRYDLLREVAFDYAFMLSQFGITK
ncbi:MAG: S9 family peptidase [Acidobacteria bacterium]|nr:S9 family peptidase [Acidobacteriota bacterium]